MTDAENVAQTNSRNLMGLVRVSGDHHVGYISVPPIFLRTLPLSGKPHRGFWRARVLGSWAAGGGVKKVTASLQPSRDEVRGTRHEEKKEYQPYP